MAAYRSVYDSCRLQADCQAPGSTPAPYAREWSMGCIYLYFFTSISRQTYDKLAINCKIFRKIGPADYRQLNWRLSSVRRVTGDRVARRSEVGIHGLHAVRRYCPAISIGSIRMPVSMRVHSLPADLALMDNAGCRKWHNKQSRLAATIDRRSFRSYFDAASSVRVDCLSELYSIEWLCYPGQRAWCSRKRRTGKWRTDAELWNRGKMRDSDCSINQSIKTLIQVDRPQRDKVKWMHMLKWIKNEMYNDKQQQ